MKINGGVVYKHKWRWLDQIFKSNVIFPFPSREQYPLFCFSFKQGLGEWDQEMFIFWKLFPPQYHFHISWVLTKPESLLLRIDSQSACYTKAPQEKKTCWNLSSIQIKEA